MTASRPTPPPAAAPPSLDTALTVITSGLDEVAGSIMERTGGIEATEKSDGTPVTDADTFVDDRLRAHLSVAFPSHGVLSEERGTTAPSTEWTWVIDPVDGTSNYINGLPYWCISVALLHDGEPVLAVIDAPVLARRYTAIAGSGARLQARSTSLDGQRQQPVDRALRVRAPVDWRDPTYSHVPVMLTTRTARRARGAGLALNPRVMGSLALDMAMVAEGVAAASVAVEPKVWDIAAGVLLVREAGGVVVTLEREPLLPLPRGVEQQGRSAITATGPDRAYVEELGWALLT